jgi:hypothetical protein
VVAGYSDGKKQLKINAIALARDTMSGFYSLKQKVRSGTDKPLLERMVQARNLALPVSKDPTAGQRADPAHLDARHVDLSGRQRDHGGQQRVTTSD